MKSILLVAFFSISLPFFGQKLFHLTDSSSSTTGYLYKDSLLTIKRGNLVIVENYVQEKFYPKEYQNIYESERTNIKYLFSSIVENPHGWLISDKGKERVIYFSQEFILVLNVNTCKIIYEKKNKSGFDVFVYSVNSGFLNPIYEYENGILYFDKVGVILRCKKSWMLNVIDGKIDKRN